MDMLKTKFTMTENNTKVIESHKLSDEKIEKLVEDIIKQRSLNGLKVTRTKQSYIREIKAHNRLYKLGLFRSHTKDTDLEENITSSKEKIFMLIGR